MKITKKQLKQIIREEKRRMRECGEMDDVTAVAVAEPVVDPVGAADAVMESQTPEGELVVEMEMASRNLELAVESINAAASLCPSCIQEVAAAAPLIEAMVTQAEALQETLDAVGAVVTESAELDFTGDVEELEPGEAFAVGYQAGQEGF